jgi:hypothetical protein
MISCSERSENSNPRSSLVCAQMLLLWKTAAGETSTRSAELATKPEALEGCGAWRTGVFRRALRSVLSSPKGKMPARESANDL